MVWVITSKPYMQPEWNICFCRSFHNMQSINWNNIRKLFFDLTRNNSNHFQNKIVFFVIFFSVNPYRLSKIMKKFHTLEFLPWQFFVRSPFLDIKSNGFLCSSPFFQHIDNCILSVATKFLMEFRIQFICLYNIKKFVITL